MRIICGFWVVFNLIWLLVLFVMLGLKSSVIISEPRPWLAWFEVAVCALSLPAFAYLMIGRRD